MTCDAYASMVAALALATMPVPASAQDQDFSSLQMKGDSAWSLGVTTTRTVPTGILAPEAAAALNGGGTHYAA